MNIPRILVGLVLLGAGTARAGGFEFGFGSDAARLEQVKKQFRAILAGPTATEYAADLVGANGRAYRLSLKAETTQESGARLDSGSIIEDTDSGGYIRQCDSFLSFPIGTLSARLTDLKTGQTEAADAIPMKINFHDVEWTKPSDGCPQRAKIGALSALAHDEDAFLEIPHVRFYVTGVDVEFLYHVTLNRMSGSLGIDGNKYVLSGISVEGMRRASAGEELRWTDTITGDRRDAGLKLVGIAQKLQ